MMRTADDVIAVFKKAVEYKQKGHSQRKVMKLIKKQLTSIKRVRHIYELYVTRREKFEEVRTDSD